MSVLQEVISKALEVYPQDTARIERAAAIVHMDGVARIGTLMYAVKSPTSATTYVVEGDYCPCPDRQNREVVCKHIWSTYLVRWTARRAQQKGVTS